MILDTEGKVVCIDGASAVVEVIRRGACGGNCADCSGCQEQVMQVEVLAEIPVSPGDRVLISSDQKPILLGLFTVFILPLLLPIGVYLLTMQTGLGGLYAALAVIVAIILIWSLSKSKWYLKKTKPRILRVISEKR